MVRRFHTRGMQIEVLSDRFLNASLPPEFTDPNETDWNLVGNESSSGGESDHQSPFLMIVSVIVLLLCCCGCMRTQQSDEARRRLARYHRKRAYNPADHRGDQIDKSLSVQRVVAVDSEGNVQLEDLETMEGPDGSDFSCDEEYPLNHDTTKSQASAVSEGNLSGDNLIACCCICLEPYRVGDVVAWSNNTSEECLHVFHKDCIVQWLENLKHDECPSCRTIILQPHDPFADEEDEEGSREGEQTIDLQFGDEQKSQGSHNNTGSVAYCIMQGLLSRVRHARFSLIGQTISFDSDDSGLQQCTSYEDESSPKFWTKYPSPFRRVMSYGDHLFSKRRSVEWKSVETEEDHFVGVPTRRASTKLILDPKSQLLSTYKMRRALSAGPCTPILANRHQSRGNVLNHPLIMDSLGPSPSVDSEPSDLVIPFRRSSSLRLRFKNSEIGNENNATPFLEEASGNHDSSFLPFTASVRKNSVNWSADIEMDFGDNTDRTEEDDILIHKAS